MVLPGTKDQGRECQDCAVPQDVDSKSVTLTATNINIFYGSLPGRKTTSADAVRAYVQALLKAKNRKFVKSPRSYGLRSGTRRATRTRFAFLCRRFMVILKLAPIGRDI